MYQHAPNKWNCVHILQCGFNQKVLGASFQIDNVEGSSTKKLPSLNIIAMYLEERFINFISLKGMHICLTLFKNAYMDVITCRCNDLTFFGTLISPLGACSKRLWLWIFHLPFYNEKPLSNNLKFEWTLIFLWSSTLVFLGLA